MKKRSLISPYSPHPNCPSVSLTAQPDFSTANTARYQHLIALHDCKPATFFAGLADNMRRLFFVKRRFKPQGNIAGFGLGELISLKPLLQFGFLKGCFSQCDQLLFQFDVRQFRVGKLFLDLKNKRLHVVGTDFLASTEQLFDFFDCIKAAADSPDRVTTRFHNVVEAVQVKGWKIHCSLRRSASHHTALNTIRTPSLYTTNR